MMSYHTYLLSIVRGEQPTANGAPFGSPWLDGVRLAEEVYRWVESHGVGQPGDDLTWVLVTPGEEYPGEILNLVAQMQIHLDLPEGQHTAWVAEAEELERSDDAGYEEAYAASLRAVGDDPHGL